MLSVPLSLSTMKRAQWWEDPDLTLCSQFKVTLSAGAFEIGVRDFNLGGADAYMLSVVILGGTNCRDDDQPAMASMMIAVARLMKMLCSSTVCGGGTCGEGFLICVDGREEDSCVPGRPTRGAV